MKDWKLYVNIAFVCFLIYYFTGFNVLHNKDTDRVLNYLFHKDRYCAQKVSQQALGINAIKQASIIDAKNVVVLAQYIHDLKAELSNLNMDGCDNEIKTAYDKAMNSLDIYNRDFITTLGNTSRTKQDADRVGAEGTQFGVDLSNFGERIDNYEKNPWK